MIRLLLGMIFVIIGVLLTILVYVSKLGWRFSTGLFKAAFGENIGKD